MCETPIDCGCKGRVVLPDDLRQIRSLVAKIIDKPHPDTLTHDVLRAIDAVCESALA